MVVREGMEREKFCKPLCVNWLLGQLCITYGSIRIVLYFAIG